MSCFTEAQILLAIFAAWAVTMLLLAIVLTLSVIERRRDVKRMHRDRRA